MKGMPYSVLSEHDTLEQAFQRSVGRLGDGEWRLALGGQAASQQPDKSLQHELLCMLHKPTECLTCLPNLYRVPPSPKMWFWKKYQHDKYLATVGDKVFGSTWITRPDDAPWINTVDYWARVEELWAGKDVVLVTGDEKSLTPALLHNASSVRVVKGPRQHAYAVIDQIQEEIGKPAGVVLMCLGATATVLAERLARLGVHALDLGHIGMFMKRRARAMVDKDYVASPEYRAVLRERYTQPGWGASGKHHWRTVYDFADFIKAADALDYGCGRGTLKQAMDRETINHGLQPLPMREYDPGIVGKDEMPQPADLVVCTDVLEHIEKDRLKNVLWHLKSLARKGLYLIIASGPARETLPDGRNAHLIQQPAAWWLRTLQDAGFKVLRNRTDKGLHVWIKV